LGTSHLHTWVFRTAWTPVSNCNPTLIGRARASGACTLIASTRRCDEVAGGPSSTGLRPQLEPGGRSSAVGTCRGGPYGATGAPSLHR
jgi:hypothetical protein